MAAGESKEGAPAPSAGRTAVVSPVVDPDASGLFRLLDGFLRAVGEAALDADSARRIREAMERDEIRFYVATDLERPAGVCSLTIGFSTYRAAPFGVVEDLYVVPASRGRGVARLLVERVLSDARGRGCRSVVLGCGTSDMPMYERLGFRSIGNMMARDIHV